MNISFNENDVRALREAFNRSPQVVKSEASNFLSRGIAEYNKVIMRNPWTVGASGGGAPVATANIRDTHQRQVEDWQAWIRPTAEYAGYVHEGTGSMVSRPWLEYAQETGDRYIIILQNQMLDNIIKQL